MCVFPEFGFAHNHALSITMMNAGHSVPAYEVNTAWAPDNVPVRVRPDIVHMCTWLAGLGFLLVSNNSCNAVRVQKG